jgi:hypothetical protein
MTTIPQTTKPVRQSSSHLNTKKDRICHFNNINEATKSIQKAHREMDQQYYQKQNTFCELFTRSTRPTTRRFKTMQEAADALKSFHQTIDAEALKRFNQTIDLANSNIDLGNCHQPTTCMAFITKMAASATCMSCGTSADEKENEEMGRHNSSQQQ